MRRIGVVWLCILLITSSAFVLFYVREDVEGKVIVNDGVMYTVHTPIRIDSNADFDAAHGVVNEATGDGSVGNPWIIEGWDINGTGVGYALYIGNTTDYFVVRNSYLHEASGVDTWPYFIQTGLIIYNVQNGTITNNTVSSNIIYGIFLSSSWNTTVNNNIISNSLDGIHLDSSHNNTLFDNSLSSNGQTGISLISANNNTISDNTASSNNWGIYIYNSSSNTIADNTASFNVYNGIDLDSSIGNTIVNNTASSNTITGIYLDTISDNNNIVGNNVSSNGYHGVVLRSSSNNTVANNTADSNGYQGIFIYDYAQGNIIMGNTVSSNNYQGIRIRTFSDGNTIYHNKIIDNAVQAYDEGNNSWDNGYPSGGNYWSDYKGVDNNNGVNQNIPGADGIGDTPHTNIDGGAGAQDNYPLIEPLYGGAPISDVDPILPYWQITTPILLTANASDDYGLKNVTLSYRFSDNNNTWGNWESFGTDTSSPWSWSFGFPDGEGYYEFYSIAVDKANKSEVAPVYADAFCIYNNRPVITLNTPANNSVILPGTVIDFSVTDDHLDTVNYTVNSGINQTLDPPYNINTTGWVDGAYIIVVHAIDQLGYDSKKSYNFTIDGTAPTIVSTIPAHDSVEVALSTTIQIAFNEAMDTSSVELAISFDPMINVSGYSWLNDTTLTITISENLSYSTAYTITLGTNATDAVGNSLTSQYSFSFTTLLDTDSDGIPDFEDPDDDNDGFLDDWEEFLGTDQKDPNDVPLDTDGDGIPDGDENNTQSWMDTDDDDDGVLDAEDPDPLDPTITSKGGLGDYWWALLLMVVIIIVSLLFFMRRKPEEISEPEPVPETMICTSCGLEIEVGGPCPVCGHVEEPPEAEPS